MGDKVIAGRHFQMWTLYDFKNITLFSGNISTIIKLKQNDVITFKCSVFNKNNSEKVSLYFPIFD